MQLLAEEVAKIKRFFLRAVAGKAAAFFYWMNFNNQCSMFNVQYSSL
jgi:hypothetical protein